MKAIEDDTFETYLLSLERCTAKPRFLSAFYDRFLASSPEVARMFEHTDLIKQRQMLNTALNLLAGMGNASPDAVSELERIARSHGRRGLNVEPRLFDSFVVALVDTVRTTDPEFDQETERAWRRVMERGVDFFLEHR